MGDADGQLTDGMGCAVQRNACVGLVFGSRGRTNGENDRSSRAGGGAVSPLKWTKLLSGNWISNCLFLALIHSVYTAGTSRKLKIQTYSRSRMRRLCFFKFSFSDETVKTSKTVFRSTIKPQHCIGTDC